MSKEEILNNITLIENRIEEVRKFNLDFCTITLENFNNEVITETLVDFTTLIDVKGLLLLALQEKKKRFEYFLENNSL